MSSALAEIKKKRQAKDKLLPRPASAKEGQTTRILYESIRKENGAT